MLLTFIKKSVKNVFTSMQSRK